MDCSQPGSYVHGIFQAMILEWIAISFSRRPSQPRDWTLVSCIAGKFFTIQATREAVRKHRSGQLLGWLPCLARSWDVMPYWVSCGGRGSGLEPVSGSMELSELSLLFPPPLLLVLMSPLISLFGRHLFHPLPWFPLWWCSSSQMENSTRIELLFSNFISTRQEWPTFISL